MLAWKAGKALAALSLVALFIGLPPDKDAAASQQQSVGVNDLARDVERLESLREVKDLQRSYVQYGQFGLWDDVAALFTQDARLEWGDNGIDGRDAILGWLKQRAGGQIGLAPGALNTEFIDEPLVNLSIDGNSAKGRWMSIAFRGDGKGTAWFEGGIYENDYRLEDGAWRIAAMRYFPQFEGDYADGWRNVDEKALPRIPYHFTVDETGIPIPAPQGPAPTTGETLDNLEQRIAALNDEDGVRNIQNAYGYYVDRKMWDDVIDLFAEDCAVEIDGVGVFKGREGVREAIERRMGPAGLHHGELNERPLFDTIVKVAPSGNEAESRGIELGLLGEADRGTARWEITVYRNRFVKEGGIWKLKELRLYPIMKADYYVGWGSGIGIMGEAKPKLPAFLGPNPATGRPVSTADFSVIATEPLTGAIARTGSYKKTVVDDRLADARRRLMRSLAFDAVVNVAGAYGYYLDDFQWTEMAGIFALKGNKQSPFAGFYVGRDRIIGQANANWGPAKALREQISLHWLIQPVVFVSHDGRSANHRSRLFQVRTSQKEPEPGYRYMGGFHGGMYPNNQFVLEDGIWRLWSLTIDEHYFYSYDWKSGWSGATDIGPNAPKIKSKLLDKYPPDVLLTDLGRRQEGFRGGTGVEVDWPSILPMWFNYRNPVSGRAPDLYWPDCVPCEKLPEARLINNGYQMPPTGPQVDGFDVR